jgi:hypothetical protein
MNEMTLVGNSLAMKFGAEVSFIRAVVQQHESASAMSAIVSLVSAARM